MLRDEGGRLADEESQVHIGAAPPGPKDYDFDFDNDNAAPAPPPAPSALRPDVPAKPALVVGLAQARNKRQTGGPVRNKPASVAPPMPDQRNPLGDPMRPLEPMRSNKPPSGGQAVRSVAPPQPGRGKPPTMPPPVPGSRTPRRTAPPPPVSSNPFHEKTRAMDDHEIVAAVRGAPGPGRFDEPSTSPRSQAQGRSLFDEPTRMGDIDAHLLESTKQRDTGDLPPPSNAEYPPKFLDAATELDPMFGKKGLQKNSFPSAPEDEATRMANVDVLAKQQKRAPASPSGSATPRRAVPPPGVSSKRSPVPVPSGPDDSTRAVDIGRSDRKERKGDPNRDPAMGDVDWDID